MSVLLKNVSNSIWHAFNALHQEQTGIVNKSKLKVLTANIATLLDLYGVEKGLDHFRSTSFLNFEHFKFYLHQEVFQSLPNVITNASILWSYQTKIEELCWLVCRKMLMVHCQDNRYSYTNEYAFKLFRIFCMLGEMHATTTINNVDNRSEVMIHSSDVVELMEKILTSLCLEFNKEEYRSSLKLWLRFDEFLSIFEFREYKALEDCRASLLEAVDDLYCTLIEDVLKKGHLLRRGYLLPALREYWFVLKPCALAYFKNANEKELCGTIVLTPVCTIKPSPFTGKHDKFQRFIITTGERSFEFATKDHRSRMQWISAIQLAITYSAGKEGYQRYLWTRRQKERDVLEQKRQEEVMFIDRIKSTRVELERERMARLAAENQARELEAVVKEDSRRVAELEDVKLTLEQLLVEETQAKHDEEIVRDLQSRILAEEWEKREELEQLQEEQKILLEQERQKRLEFEIQQKQKENQLRNAEIMLKQLEYERERLDKELQQARCKIQQSEEYKEILEKRMQEVEPFPSGGDRVRRSLSFLSPKEMREVAMFRRHSKLAPEKLRK